MKKLSIKQQAAKNGDKTFITGKKCKWGHLSPRLTRTSTCIACKELVIRNKRRFKPFNEPIGNRGPRWGHEVKNVQRVVRVDVNEFDEMAKRICKKNQKW